MPTVWLHQSNKKKCLFNFIWKDVTKTISLDNDGGSYSQVTQKSSCLKVLSLIFLLYNSILLLMFLLAFTSFCYPILFGCCLQLPVCQMQIRHPVGIKLIPKIRCFSGLKMNSTVTLENIFCKVVTNYGCKLPCPSFSRQNFRIFTLISNNFRHSRKTKIWPSLFIVPTTNDKTKRRLSIQTIVVTLFNPPTWRNQIFCLSHSEVTAHILLQDDRI